jgi:multidrug resistance protein
MAGNGIPRRLLVLMGIVFVDMIGVLMILPLLPYYATDFNASGTEVGLLTSIFAAAQVLSAPIWGRLSDRLGRRPIILFGLIGAAVGYLFFGFADALWMLFATRLFQGVGAGTIGVIQAYVSDSVEAKDRAKALGWLTAAASAGVMLGPIIGSFFSEQFGRSAPGLFAAALCIANLVFALRLLPESSAGPSGQRRSLLRAMGEVLTHPAAPANWMVWVYSIGMMAFMAMNALMGLYLMEVFSITELQIGWFYTYVGGLSVVMRAALLGPILDRIGEVRAMQVGTTCMAVGLLAAPLVDHVALFLAVVALIPIGTAMFFPASTSILSQRSPKGEVGQMLGVQQSFRGIAGIAGPAWAGVAYDHVSKGAPFVIGAMVMAVAVLATLRVATADGEAPESNKAA